MTNTPSHRISSILVALAAFLTHLILAVNAVSASGSQVWGIESQDFAQRVARSDYGFLRHISFRRERIGEAKRLGDDAALALGIIYHDLGLPSVASRLLEFAWSDSGDPWRLEAFRRLASLYGEEDQYVELERLAREGIDRYPAFLEMREALIRALYHQDRFDEVYPLAIDLLAEIADLEVAPSYAAEAALWASVSGSSVGQAGWPDLYRALYRDFPAGDAHSRVWIYLTANGAIRDHFSPDDLDYFQAKSLLAEGRGAEALALMSALADRSVESDDVRGYLWSPSGMVEFYRAAAGSGEEVAAAERMVRIAGLSPPDAAAVAWEYAGRLYRQRGAYVYAAELLERSLTLADSESDRRRLTWYRLTSLIRHDPIAIAGRLDSYVKDLDLPEYFSDAFTELAGLLIEAEAWTALRGAYQAIQGFADPGTLARYQLVLAQVTAHPAEKAALLEAAAEQRGDTFTALVASTLLGRTGEAVLEIQGGRGNIDSPTPPESGLPFPDELPEPGDAGYGGRELLASTYLRFGLLDEFTALVLDSSGQIRSAMLLSGAWRLASAGKTRESINIATRAQLADEPFTRMVAQLRYPDAFAAVLDDLAQTEDRVDRWVLAALVREESYFDPDIYSVAGAVGLMQLIPATAADVARRMRLDEFDLRDPVDSLRIGTRYFSMLTSQFNSTLTALAAYNAGQGRLRVWERRWGHLGPVLFHQAMPYYETFNHVRKVVVSTAYYDYLYGERTPAESVRLIMGVTPQNPSQ